MESRTNILQLNPSTIKPFWMKLPDLALQVVNGLKLESMHLKNSG